MALGPTFTASLEAVSAATIFVSALYVFWMRPQLLNEKRSSETLRQQLAKDSDLRVSAAEIQARTEIVEAKEKLEHESKIRDEKFSLKEEALENRREALQERELLLHSEQRAITEHRNSVERRATSIQDELQRIAHLSKDQAREQLLKEIEVEFKEDFAKKARQLDDQNREETERKAKQLVLDVIQKNVSHYVAESSVSVVELSSEDMKGRIIGREGRNIRSFEQIAGVDLIIDETPEAVVISCFDPVRRETARLALMNLMLDGRIHPTRIEEIYQQAEEEMARTIKEAGTRAAERAGVNDLSAKTIEILGKLRFRSSYGQNVLDHSVEVSKFCVSLAADFGLNEDVARRAGFLHDIGKALGPEWEGPHALTGMEFLKSQGESEAVLLAVGAHHYDIEPSSAEAILVIICDTISASRPGARRENLENYVKRLSALESIANSFDGVDKSYAIQAGREVRLIVKPDEIDDLQARRLAKDVAKKIEKEFEYGGQVKITVIREVRVQEVAK